MTDSLSATNKSIIASNTSRWSLVSDWLPTYEPSRILLAFVKPYSANASDSFDIHKKAGYHGRNDDRGRKAEAHIKRSANLSIQLSNCDLIIENAERLLAYEQRGLDVGKPKPSVLISEYCAKCDKLVLDGIKREIEFAVSKAGVTGSAKPRITHLSRVLLKTQEYKPKLSDPALIAEAEAKAMKLLHQAQLDAFWEAALKAERKGQRKKAVEQYHEALYFLDHDDIDAALKATNIAEIRAKIEELSDEGV